MISTSVDGSKHLSKVRAKKTNVLHSVLGFLIFASLLFNSMIGTLAAVIFLSAGILLSVLNFSHTLFHIKKNYFLFIIPLLATTSFVWSDNPFLSLRGGIQLIITTIIAIVIAEQVKFRTMLYSASVAMMLAMIASFLVDRSARVGIEIAMIGIFASKNYLSIHTALSLFFGMMIILDENNRTVYKFIGTILCVTSIMVLIKAQSVGSIVTTAVAIIISILIVKYNKTQIPKLLRYIVDHWIPIILILVILAVIYSINMGYFDDFMYELGKDPTLTGRTWIWEKGFEKIISNPILGSGYQGVFFRGNPLAEDIWEAFLVPSGAGFNFHNMFIDISVDLGLIGFVLYCLWICLFYIRLIHIDKPSFHKKEFLAVLIITYLFLQTFLEAIWLRQFTIIHIATCIAWIYLGPEKKVTPIRIRW